GPVRSHAHRGAFKCVSHMRRSVAGAGVIELPPITPNYAASSGMKILAGRVVDIYGGQSRWWQGADRAGADGTRVSCIEGQGSIACRTCETCSLNTSRRGEGQMDLSL